jgi:hypothetical protein
VALPFAQVTATGMVAKVEVSADLGTSTLQVETTVAVTINGAEADCACSTGAPARTTAARKAQTTTLPTITSPSLRARQDHAHGRAARDDLAGQ